MAQNFGAIASGIGSFLGGSSGIASLFGSHGGTSVYKTSKIMKTQNNLQKDFSKWYLDNITSHQYRAERNSLEEAGYNPMLAYMNGSSGVPVGTPGATAQEGNSSANLTNASANFLNLASLGSQIENTNANTELQRAQAVTEQFKQLQLSADTEIKRIDEQLKRVDLKYSEKEHLLYQQKTLQEIKSMSMDSFSKMISAYADQTNAKVNEQWTPAKVVGGIATGALGAFGLGKLGKVGKVAGNTKIGKAIRSAIRSR